MAETERSARDGLAGAYERRTTQLYETRGALAEAVATLTVELRAAREHIQRVKEENDRLTDSLQQSREHSAAVEAELRTSTATATALANLKVVRWTAPLRRAVYQLRRARG